MHHQVMSSGRRPEPISSMPALVEAIKLNQVSKPKAQFVLMLGMADFSVKLLPSGYLELDGKVPSLEYEKEFSDAIARRGAALYTLN